MQPTAVQESSKGNFGPAVYRVAREWAFVIMMSHPGHSLGEHFEGMRTGTFWPFRQEKYFLRLVIGKQQLVLGADSVSVSSVEGAESGYCFQG